ncbi:hypothetical protein QI633_08145 [Nocardioides sp. QY071]|uniref:hypothetical protein n=1 Tax=Nocardioides sp. QY071 TaxID=3044187 RepID=UPI00249CEC4A|nr:hypothetical protein [Nocardioides sp. QY071]WGY03723.1 hypothetical protein QI633_08145 [Nocardioides sp. QY071]
MASRSATTSSRDGSAAAGRTAVPARISRRPLFDGLRLAAFLQRSLSGQNFARGDVVSKARPHSAHSTALSRGMPEPLA